MGADGRTGGILWRGTIDWAGDRGSGKDIAGFLCSLKILTQWHWSLGRGPVGRLYGCWDVRTGEHYSSTTGLSLDGDGSTCREGEIPFHTGCTFWNSFSCMGVCPSRHWLIQVHQGLSSGHPGLTRLPSVTPTGRYDVQRRVRAGRLLPCPLAASVTSIDVSTGVFAGLTTYANLPYVRCLSADPASVDKYDDGRLVRPLFVFEAPRQARSM